MSGTGKIMRYMFDTNICIYIIKQKPVSVIQRLLEHEPDEICISAITHAELQYGVEKSKLPEKNMAALTLFLSSVNVLDFETKAAIEYGRIRAELEKKGTPIGGMDMLIAAHARAESTILVTNNTREFCRVTDLQIENWT